MTPEAFAGLRLTDKTGRDVSDRCAAYDGQHWYVKALAHADVAAKELLTFRLGTGRVNIAEVRRREDTMDLIRPDGRPYDAALPNTVIVRLAADYRAEELPLRDLDEAVAYGLVFSTWIRKRDTHAWNHDYVGGLPLFFDHGVAFDEHPHYVDAGAFFGDLVPEAGYAARWRLAVLEPCERPDIDKLREQQRHSELATHYVRDTGAVDGLIDRACSMIMEMHRDEIAAEVESVDLGPEANARILSNLLATQQSLPNDLRTLRAVLGLR